MLPKVQELIGNKINDYSENNYTERNSRKENFIDCIDKNHSLSKLDKYNKSNNFST